MAILSILLTVVIIAVSILMVLIVLIQRPKQEGLGAAFGGGSLDSALGAHTTDILQKFTTWLGILFFVSAIGLAMVKTRQFRASAANDVLEKVEEREPTLPEGITPEMIQQIQQAAPAPASETPETEEAPKPAQPKGGEKEKAKAPAKPAAKEKAKAPAPAPAPAKGDAPKGDKGGE
ncbi:preprotein translocase subunit SecG [Verrucomicrobiales bacterium BCK34]|nr:preprotein translocase subunit SecG [Verrucomicrobiales bacterium BCK34]